MRTNSFTPPGRGWLMALALLAVVTGMAGAAPVAAPAKAGDQGSVVIGQAVISGGNRAAAKEKAIGMALAKGVEVELVRRMGGDQMSPNFERIVSDVLPKAGDLIQEFAIMGEVSAGENLYVLVRLRVNGALLDKALKDAGIVQEQEEKAPLKILILVSEKRGDKVVSWWSDPSAQPPLSTTEIFLYQAFQEEGTIPVNRLDAFPGKEVGAGMLAPALQDEDIYRWGSLFGAELVVYGQSEIRSGDAVTLTLAVYDVRRHLVAASGNASVRIGGPENPEGTDLAAVDKAVQKLVPTLKQSLSASLGPSAGELRSLDVSLQGFSSYADVSGFRNFLANSVPGVQSVKPSRAGQDAVGFEVLFRGGAAELLSLVLQSGNQPFPLAGELVSEKAIKFTAYPLPAH